MLTFELLRDKGILVARPAARYRLRIPGWDSCGVLVEHLRFVRDHHRNIKRVAAVTDSGLLPKTAEHFTHPETKVFDGAESARALGWPEGKGLQR